MAGRTAPDADHRAAYMAGRGGRAMPPGVAAKADQDPSLDLMHDAGRQGRDYTTSLAHHAPHVERQSQRSPRRPSGSGGPRRSGAGGGGRPTLVNLGSGTAVTGAGVLLGMVAYAMVLATVQHGPAGALLWLRAKYLNEPARSGSSGSAPSSSRTTTGSVHGLTPTAQKGITHISKVHNLTRLRTVAKGAA